MSKKFAKEVPLEPIIILVEEPINESGKGRSQLLGIKKAQWLRRVEQNKNPIIFTSFLPPQLLLQMQGTEILTAVGHGFVQLPYTETELQEEIRRVKALNDFQLRDIVRNFCEERGIFSNLYHSFKGQLRNSVYRDDADDSVKARNVKSLLLDFRNELKREFPNNVGLHDEFNRLTQKFNKDDLIESVKSILTINESNFWNHLALEDSDNGLRNVEEKPWKVLMLDDEPDSLSLLQRELTLRGIPFRMVRTVEEAKHEISADTKNIYTVVIADFRLLDKPNSQWIKPRLQSEQGYDFLNWLSKLYRFNALIALSGLGRNFLMESFRLQQVNVKVYSKNELDHGVKLFVDDIEYLGERYFDAVCNQPKQTDWTKTTLPYYKKLRNDINFESIEADISKRAKIVTRELYSQITLQPADLKLISLTSEFGNAQQILQEKDTEEDTLKKLTNKLVLRRVALYCLCRGIEPDDVCKLVMYGNILQPISESNKKQTIRGLHLKTEEDIPYHILPEERAWLELDMGIPIFQFRQQLDATVDIVNQYLNQSKHEKIMKQVKNNLYLDAQGRFSALSVTELKAGLNKILKETYKTEEGRKFLQDLLKLGEKMIDLMPGMENPKELMKALNLFEEKNVRNDTRP